MSGPDSTVGPVLEDPVELLTVAPQGKVLPLYRQVIRFRINVYNFRCKTLLYQILNKNL
jgi:hypothetical protein